MLTRWTLENFKPIRERLALPTAPLTVLAGLNSSGKSSFLQSILLISQTLANQKLDEPLVLNGPLVRLGTFRDICNVRADRKQVSIGFTLDSHRAQGDASVTLDMQFKAYAEDETIAGLNASRAALVSMRLSSESYSVEMQSVSAQESKFNVQATSGDRATSGSFFNLAHFMPFALPLLSESDERSLREIVNALGNTIRYLGPLRADPYVTQTYSSYSPSGLPDDVGSSGEYAAAIYATNRRQAIRFWSPMSRVVETAPLEQAMDTWARHLCVADHVTTREGAVRGVSWMVRPSSDSHEYPLWAVGVGVSQVLPILVAGLLAPEGTILIMEQPELHLHERPQARLGDFFYGLTRVGKQVFVETHSAVLINQLRYLMVKLGQEARDAIATYFVTQDEQGDARFEPIRISKGGAVENWPDGFFDESFRQEDRITEEGVRARGQRSGA
jgi:predicted ATPase